jgi:hypothetical protein
MTGYQKVAHCVLLLVLSCTLSLAQGNCNSYDTNLGPFYLGHNGYIYHSSGNHASAFAAKGSCTYTGSGPCNSQSIAESGEPGVGETGSLSSCPPTCFHVGFIAIKSGEATSGGDIPAISDTEGAVSFLACLTSGCVGSITITGLGNGTGFSVTDPKGAIWSDQQYYKNTCPPEVGTTCSGGKVGQRNGCGGNGGSPIIVDTANVGFHFTASCVPFDIEGNGKPKCLSWTEHTYKNGWLALPRGKTIRTGKQLFGNYTPQPHHKNTNPNGFLALAEYDLVANGGNLDGKIDTKDAIWPELRIWIDEHCYLHPKEQCVSLPGELHRLEEFGIRSISLTYGYKPKYDEQGNNFKYFSRMNVESPSREHPGSLQESTDDRLLYDVYLKATR